MPKTFTENERKYIKEKLIEAARDCLKLYGVRKTTVDELVRRVNIPKGTFYLFYESKELLFYEVFCLSHDELHADLMHRLETLDNPLSVDQITELFLGLYKGIETSFLYKLIISGDLELLMHKLPSEVAIEHAQKDDFSIEQLISIIPGISVDEIKVLSAAMRAIFLSMLHKHEIGEEVFEETLRLLLRGVVIQMVKEGSK